MELTSALATYQQRPFLLQDDFFERHTPLQERYHALHLELVEYKQKANYWEAQFGQSKAREEILKRENEELKAKLKKREQQLFGRKSEKETATGESGKNTDKNPKKNRGQQTGSVGHGRRDYTALPSVEETVVLSPDEACCACCGLPYEELGGSEDSDILEIIQVQGYCRKIHRKRYKRQCACPANLDPEIVTPPPADRLIPKSNIGVSIWVFLLLNKYGYQHPMHRVLQQLSGSGLSLPQGTVTDGLQKLLPLFVPLYDLIVERNQSAIHWHADETGWKVFEVLEGKANNRWFLWIFRNAETMVYKIHPTRSAQVLREHFGEEHPGGILNVDRYSAYKAIARAGLFILAFCWAHVRRDFLAHAKAYKQQEAWGLAWVELIAGLYHINNQRILHEPKSQLFIAHDRQLKDSVAKMRETLNIQRADQTLLPASKKLLDSLEHHWDGLTIFVEHPEIPMDNNLAENGLRSPVVGKKGYYGSGSIWSAEFAAVMFTIFGTLKLAGINWHSWLAGYLQECLFFGGKVPDAVERFLPWNMIPRVKELLSKPPKYETPILNSS